jgi:carboxylate-amine ligase
MRTFGVEEELLLIDGMSGQPLPVSRQLLDRHESSRRSPRSLREPQLTSEMQQEMIEVVTAPHSTLPALLTQIGEGRSLADGAARAIGARVAALATCPVPVQPHPDPRPRYQEMVDRFGTTARNSLSCGVHVHVSIDSPDEGVAVLDRIRAWLPVLIALSANSPFQNGEDTGYASFRSVTWREWPSAGPTDVFGSFRAYREYERQLLDTGALLDDGMLYFDARLSRNFPTVEVRVADVCLDPTHSATIAALVRALVETSAVEWRDGRDPAPVSSAAIRLASWMAARSGLRGTLVDPVEGRERPAGEVVHRLLEHVRPALDAAHDLDFVEAQFDSMLTAGTGADWQRAEFARLGSLSEVVRRAADRTAEGARLG